MCSSDLRGLYVKYYLLVTRAAFLEQEPATVAAILRAVLAAEKAARANPAAAQTALAGKLQVTTAIAALLWPDMDLRVSLPQALVLCLEDEARWAARSGFVTNRPPPNFLTMMHVATLEQLVPDEVTIIR